MIQSILVAATCLVGGGGIALAAWSIRHTRSQATLIALMQMQCSLIDCANAVRALIRAMRQHETIAELTTPLCSAQAPSIHFDAWMQQRTERAHREFMERTSRRLPCDATTEDIARYLRVPLT